MSRQSRYLAIFAVCAELACASVPGHAMPPTDFTDMSETALRHQLGPVTSTNTFTLSDPMPEERVEILNFVKPDWGNKTAETIKEMIWEPDRKRLVVWLRQQNNHWRAFHHHIIPSGSVDCGSYH